MHQEAYITKVLKRFYMDMSHPLCTPIVVWFVEVNKDHFKPREKDEDIGIALSISSPTRRHWNEVKHVLRYLRGTMDMSLFYLNVFKTGLIGYANITNKILFTYSGIVISWKHVKQTTTATSTNHVEILALNEAREMSIIYEDNVACITQLKERYINRNRTKHILSKLFFTHDL
ncbi:hypothetical protein CR513_43038, partial [Mucuna pruriens]